ncbi:hypothetical protein GCG21_06110 [Pseudactinotalea sp. HY160]|uniref:hypothetical protein n=1 Tax=Pseudactinotalea sp. HY160 TaxID=2654490 RepID=UPI00128C0AD3|nr:hypothetical protein [Pseudactinotalea sp. HY160]MPV49586.1 hypothetical protein [Pseudactinotalea sp. HY160]
MTIRRALATLTAGVAIAALSAGCGVRIGSPPAPIPSPDAVEQLRQLLARNATGVADVTSRVEATSANAAEGPGPADLFGLVSDIGSEQAGDLGGVWTPPPRPATDTHDPADPAGSGDPTDPVDPTEPTESTEPAVLSPEAAVAELTASLTELADLAEQDLPEGWISTVGSMLVTRQAMVGAGRDLLGLDCGPVCPAPLAPVNLNDGATKDSIIAHLDAIGYLGEIAAAQADGEEQEALAARAADHRAAARTMIAAAAGTDADPRRPAYAIGADGVDTAIRLRQGELVAAWIAAAQESRGPERAAALDQAWTAYFGTHGGAVVGGPWPGLLSGPGPSEPDRSTP